MEEGLEALWNLDAAELYLLFKMKSDFVDAIGEWDLERAYWALRHIRMELDAKLKRREGSRLISTMEAEKAKRRGEKVIPEKDRVDAMMEEVDSARKEFLNSVNPTNEDKSKFYNILERFYMELCFIMKRHGLYFREGDDNRLAILKR